MAPIPHFSSECVGERGSSHTTSCDHPNNKAINNNNNKSLRRSPESPIFSSPSSKSEFVQHQNSTASLHSPTPLRGVSEEGTPGAYNNARHSHTNKKNSKNANKNNESKKRRRVQPRRRSHHLKEIAYHEYKTVLKGWHKALELASRVLWGSQEAKVTGDAMESLKHYTYHGEDRSKIYAYVWRPLCRAAVSRTSLWISANTITVTALVFGILPYVWYLIQYISLYTNFYYGTSSSTPYDVAATLSAQHTAATAPVAFTTLIGIPPFVFVLNAAVLLLYQFLDNLDGHQARKLGMSSPLGLWMDHGCDAFHSVVMTFCVSYALSLGPTWKTLSLMLSALVAFYMNTWEEYHLGALILPVINGPNEGIIIMVIMYIWTAMRGSAWWLNTLTISRQSVSLFFTTRVRLPSDRVDKLMTATEALWFTAAGGEEKTYQVQYNTLFVAVELFAAVFTCCGNIYNVWSKRKRGAPARNDEDGDNIVRRDNNNHHHHLKEEEDEEEEGEEHDDGDDGDGDGPVKTKEENKQKMEMIITQSKTRSRMRPRSGEDKKKKKQAKGGKVNEKDAHLLQPRHIITTLLPPFALTLVTGFCVAVTDWYIRAPTIFCWVVGLLFTYITIMLMLSHMESIPLHDHRATTSWYRGLGTLVVLSCLSWACGRWKGGSHSNLVSMIVVNVFLVRVSVALASLAIRTASTIAVGLNITIFVVPLEKQRKLRRQLNKYGQTHSAVSRQRRTKNQSEKQRVLPIPNTKSSDSLVSSSSLHGGRRAESFTSS